MTTYSYGLVVTELEMEALEEALHTYADVCREQIKKGSHKHGFHLEQIAEISQRLFSDRMLASFTYRPGDPVSERLREEWLRGGRRIDPPEEP